MKECLHPLKEETDLQNMKKGVQALYARAEALHINSQKGSAKLDVVKSEMSLQIMSLSEDIEYSVKAYNTKAEVINETFDYIERLV